MASRSEGKSRQREPSKASQPWLWKYSFDIDQSNTNGISVHTISNGVLDIELSPDFAGSVTSIKFRGAEQLFSSFPNRSALGWLSPWFGGIMPIIYPCSLTPEDDDNYVYPGRLYREKITAESSAQMDKQYNKWQGVTLSSFIQDEDFKGIEFAFSVYTLPFSNVIKLKVSLANSTAAHKKAYCGYSCFAAPSGNRKTSILQYEGTEQRPTIIGKWRQAGYWALALDPETNFSVGLTSCHQSFFQSGWGEEGNYIDFISTANLLPKQEIEYVSYMYFISKHSQFEQYNELKHLL